MQVTEVDVAAALRLVFNQLPTRWVCVAAGVAKGWRHAALPFSTRLNLDGEADAGPALRTWLHAQRVITSLSLEFARGVTDEDVGSLASASLTDVNLNVREHCTSSRDSHFSLCVTCFLTVGSPPSGMPRGWRRGYCGYCGGRTTAEIAAAVLERSAYRPRTVGLPLLPRGFEPVWLQARIFCCVPHHASEFA